MFRTAAKTVLACLMTCSLSGCYTLQYSGYELPDDSLSFTRNSQARVERHVTFEERAVYLLMVRSAFFGYKHGQGSHDA